MADELRSVEIFFILKNTLFCCEQQHLSETIKGKFPPFIDLISLHAPPTLYFDFLNNSQDGKIKSYTGIW